MEAIHSTSGEVEWTADNQHVFFVTKDHQERPFKVWRHGLTEKVEDVAVFEEADEAFYVGIGKSRSEKLIFIECGESLFSAVLAVFHAGQRCRQY